ncbi:MAG: GTP 3',8-cyclase MoaA [Gammaproteobacteria bacterium]|nr:GTP 3',8-cyclase MoaA [Gammaproteobacteria bacterium]
MNRQLIDPFQRRIDYVRISVTDQCDLRCDYCLPKGFKDFEEPENWLTFDEITRVTKAFTELGVGRIRLTGGEPLVRKNFPDLVKKLGQLPQLEDLSLSTNAVKLGKVAGELKAHGLHRINVSLDSLDPKQFAAITGGGKLHKVLDGLMAAKAAGLGPIKINMVAMKGVNDHEIGEMLEFCIEHEFTLRLIETMPMGTTGRSATDRYLDLQPVRAQLAERYGLIPDIMPGGGPARYMRVVGSDSRIGFITPISQHFCESCNRVRLSVDGTLYLCLGQNDRFELRPMLRAGIDDDALKTAIVEAISLKPEKHEFKEEPGKLVRFMSATGG